MSGYIEDYVMYTHVYFFSTIKKFKSNSVWLTPKILSDMIWVVGYFGQPLTYPYFTIYSSNFLCNSLKS
jgi:hypothetical protein